MPTAPSDGFLNRPLLRQLADEEMYAAGERYVSEGRVRQPQLAVDRVTARVAGTRVYRAKIWRTRGELQFSCSCAAGRENVFCEHCVAVGLTWVLAAERAAVDAPPDAPIDPGTEKAARTREKIQDHLRGLDRDRLVNLVLEATDYDDILRRRLLMETIGVASPGRKGPAPDFAAYRQLLHDAIDTPDYVDYDAMPDYVHGVAEAVHPLGDLLRSGHAATVVELVELALVQLDRASEMIDASDGSLNAVYDDLQSLHLEACRAARVDPEALAARLLHFELEGGLGVFNNAAKAYADILGPKGLAAWRDLLIAEWSAQPPPSPAPADIDYRRFQLQALMETLAGSEGDRRMLAAVKQRDLSSPHDYLSVAEWHLAAGHADEALSWAERGSSTFPNGADSAGLRDFLVTAYHRVSRHDEAIALVWNQFAESQSVEHFRLLKSHAELASGSWTPWRDRALTLTRENLAAQHTLYRERGWTGGPDHSLLVEFLVSDEAIEDAWAEAKAGGCRPELWLQLADRRVKTHPIESLQIYQQRLEPIIAQGGARAYKEAIEMLTRISTLLDEMGRTADYDLFRAEVRATHRQRRNFVKLLDASGH